MKNPGKPKVGMFCGGCAGHLILPESDVEELRIATSRWLLGTGILAMGCPGCGYQGPPMICLAPPGSKILKVRDPKKKQTDNTIISAWGENECPFKLEDTDDSNED